MKVNKICRIIKEEGYAGVAKRVKNKFFTKAYSYKLSLNDFKVFEYDIEKYNFKELTIESLDKMLRYCNEIGEVKYSILKNRIEDKEYNNYIVEDRNNNICGYFSLAFKDINDSCINYKVKVGKGYAYLFDDYTFEQFRGAGVHKFSIFSRLKIAKEQGNKYAIVDILDGTVPSERAYTKFGFKKSTQYNYYHILKFKKTFVKEVN